MSSDQHSGRTRKPRAYSYVRFSTTDQRKGDSLARQTKQAQQWCDANGVELDTELSCQDLGVSAFRGHNAVTGKLAAFRRMVEDGDIEVGSYLLVENLDRLSRNYAVDVVNLVQSILDLGITIVLLHTGKQYTRESIRQDQFAVMELYLTAIRAHEESLTKRKRSESNWEKRRQEAAKSGKAATGRVPGWIRINEQGKCQLIEDRAQTVRLIFELCQQGQGLTAIAQTLNAEGVKPFGRGKMWQVNDINRILRNPAVIGKWTPKSYRFDIDGNAIREPLETVEGYFPRVVSDDDFAAAHRAMSARKPKFKNAGTHGDRSKAKFLLGGLAVCPKCGAPVYRVSGRQVYLYCKRKKLKAGCDWSISGYRDIEQAIIKQLPWILSQRPIGDTQVDSEIAELRHQIDIGEDAVNRILEQISETEGPAARRRLGEELEFAQNEINGQERRLRELVEAAQGVSVRAAERAAEAVLKGIDEGNTRQINTGLRSLVKSVIIDTETGEALFRWIDSKESFGVTVMWPDDDEDTGVQSLPTASVVSH
jgi:DNA invertase Pin-like site-specific DNA recombinase